MDKLFHDPHNFEATNFNQFVVKLHKLNELSTSPNDWGPNLYHATKDIPDDQELKDRCIRYLANPSGNGDVVFSNMQEQVELNSLKGSGEHPTADFDLIQSMKVVNVRVHVVDVEVNPIDDEKVET